MMMPMRTIFGLTAAAAVLAAAPAWAAHGKAGLWNVTSATSLDMTMPPGMQDQMKGMKSAPNTHTTQMCMSQEEVNSDRPPHIDQRQTGCDTHVTSMSG